MHSPEFSRSVRRRAVSARLSGHERCQCRHLVRLRLDRPVDPEGGDRRRCGRGHEGSGPAAGRAQPGGARGERVHRCRRPDDRRARRRRDRRGGRPRRRRHRSTPTACASPRRRSPGPRRSTLDLATTLADVDGVDAKAAGQAVTEGVLLASYRYVGRKTDRADIGSKLEIADARRGRQASAKQVEQGAERGVRRRHVGGARPRAGQHAADLPQRRTTSPTRAVDIAAEIGLDGRGVQQGPARTARLRWPARREPRLGRAAAHGQAHVHAAQPDRSPRPGRQGDHVRLGWHLAEGRRRVPPDHEDGHVGRRGGAVDDVGAQGAALQDEGHRVPDVHRQHAVGQRR